MGTIAQLPASENFVGVGGSPFSITIDTTISGTAVWADLGTFACRVFVNGTVITAGTYGPTVSTPSANVILLSWSSTQTAAMVTAFGNQFTYELDTNISSVGPYALMAGSLILASPGTPGASTTTTTPLSVVVGTSTVNLSVVLGGSGSLPIPVYATPAARDAEIPSPTEGQITFQSDTNSITVYQSATTGWTALWNLPWGYIGSASRTTQQGGITTIVDITSMSVTWTAVANRRYRITGSCLLLSSVAADCAQLLIADGSNTVVELSQVGMTVANIGMTAFCTAHISPASGSTTYKLRVVRSSGTGNIAFDAGSTYPAYLIVEDIGPNGNPV